MQIQTTPEIIPTIKQIHDLVVLNSEPPMLFVRASGLVPTSGRCNGSLAPRFYRSPPEDRIQEFDFLASPARDVTLKVESEIFGEGILHELPDWAVGVRIVGAMNHLEQQFPIRSDPLVDEATCDAVAVPSTSFAPPHCSVSATSMLITSFEGYSHQRAETRKGTEFLIASLTVPETKTARLRRCVLTDPKSGDCLLTARVPVIYRRNVRHRLLARIRHNEQDITAVVLKEALKEAVRKGIALDALTDGSLQSAAIALESHLRGLLEIPGGLSPQDMAVELRRETMPGPWDTI